MSGAENSGKLYLASILDPHFVEAGRQRHQ